MTRLFFQNELGTIKTCQQVFFVYVFGSFPIVKKIFLMRSRVTETVLIGEIWLSSAPPRQLKPFISSILTSSTKMISNAKFYDQDLKHNYDNILCRILSLTVLFIKNGAQTIIKNYTLCLLSPSLDFCFIFLFLT